MSNSYTVNGVTVGPDGKPIHDKPEIPWSIQAWVRLDMLRDSMTPEEIKAVQKFIEWKPQR